MLALPQTLAPVRLDAGRSEVHLAAYSATLRLRLRCQKASRWFVAEPPDLLGYCRWDGRSGRVTTPDNHRDDFQVAPTHKTHPQAPSIA